MSVAERIAAEAIGALSSEQEERLSAARAIKNAVVGNPTNKRLYVSLGALPPLTAAANEVHSQPQLAAQAVAALGSLACYIPPDAVGYITSALLRCLFAPNPDPVHAAARALKLFVTSDTIDPSTLGASVVVEDVAARIVSLLPSTDEGIAEVCAVIIARTSIGNPHAIVFERASAIPALVRLLWRTNHERCVEACLNALSALARHSRPISRALTGPHALVTIVMPLTRSRIHTLRLAACRLLTIFHSASLLPPGLDGVVSVALVNLLTAPDHAAQVTTALTLSELVNGSPDLQGVATEAGAVVKLARMVFDVADSDHTSELDTNMKDERGPQGIDHACRNALKASAFTALAAITSAFDTARDIVISYDVLPSIIDALSERDTNVVLASVKCIRSLSRSVKIVRKDIASESVGRTLLRLLSFENKEIRRNASAALCNLVLEFSPVRGIVVDGGGTTVLVGLLSSDDEEVRKNALWALKNLLFKADPETKAAVMAELGYDRIQVLCGDVHPRVRLLAMTVMRNLASSGAPNTKNEQLDDLLAATGDRLVSILSDALKLDTTSPEIAVQALYVVCNIASGTEEHKASLINSDIPQLILQWTSHDDEQARIAAVWCAINLSWKERPTMPQRAVRRSRRLQRSTRSAHSRLEMLRRQHLPLPSSPVERRLLERSDAMEREDDAPSPSSPREMRGDAEMDSVEADTSEDALAQSDNDSGILRSASTPKPRQEQGTKDSGYTWRIERLRELGFEGRLRSLVNDPHIEVQGRARAALELFDCDDVHPLDYDPSALLDYNPSSLLSRNSPHSPPVLLSGAGSESSLAGSSS